MSLTPFTTDWLLDSVEAVDRRVVSNVETKEIGDGKGMVSRVFESRIHFEGSTPQLAVVVKIPQIFDKDVFGDPTRGRSFTKFHLARNHNRECDFYTDFAQKLEIEIPLGTVYRADKWIPGESEGALVMQSFVGSAKSECFFKGFSEAQLYEIAKHLVQLNKYFLCLEDKTWTEKYQNVMWNQMEVVNYFINPMIDKLRALNSEEFRENLDKIYPLLNKQAFHEYTSSGVQEALSKRQSRCGSVNVQNYLPSFATATCGRIIFFGRLILTDRRRTNWRPSSTGRSLTKELLLSISRDFW